ncbi:hypothetical protein [Dehalobacter sp. 14DCB1]|uniref:hypothetical protein n=1 Tax=Dehalobacter sp. 14DCB1 TaxID=2070227 RepID=UPI00104573C8|nr:hypothetical protein [Dehalobacter sp. 14DCB1]TCX53805.1 hypothetical protein C1I36_03480 [Dehalobacter sp. 14DCB1]
MKTEKRFGELLIEKENALLVSKGNQYSSDVQNNRWQNFYEVAAFEGRTPEEVAISYLLKHIQSINVAIRKGEFDWCWVNSKGEEGLMQRFADARNYLWLLGNMIDDHVYTAYQQQ